MIHIMIAHYLIIHVHRHRRFSHPDRFFLDPGMLLMYALLVAVPLWAATSTSDRASPALAPWERKAANWMLLNGAVFHVFMDGLCGTFGFGGQLATDYHKLDSRFAHGDPYLKIVTGMELFLYTPLCFLAYRAIVHGFVVFIKGTGDASVPTPVCLGSLTIVGNACALHSSRLPTRPAYNILVSTCHLFGLVVFVGAELLQGCRHIPASEPVGGSAGVCFSNIKWPPTENQFTYFWFGFVLCNIPWVVVPLRLIKGAFDDIAGGAKAKGA